MHVKVGPVAYGREEPPGTKAAKPQNCTKREKKLCALLPANQKGFKPPHTSLLLFDEVSVLLLVVGRDYSSREGTITN